MAYTQTHLTVQGLLVWLLLPKKTKEYYTKHRVEYLIINLFALLPDIDVLFRAHRTYTHSVIPPLFFLLSLVMIGFFAPKSLDEHDTGKRVIRFLKLAAVMWIIHIMFDLGWGAMLLFWPLDSSFYDLSMFFRFENQPWLFLPLRIVGFVPYWKLYTFNEGRNIFFINGTQAERQEIFGNYIDLYLQDFMISVLLVITWLVVIFFPVFKRTKKRKNGSFNKMLTTTAKRLKRQLTGLGVFFIFLGIILGPALGQSYMFSNSFRVSLVNTHNQFDPTLGFMLEKQEMRTINVDFSVERGLVDIYGAFMLVSNTTFLHFFDNFTLLTEQYYNKTISYTELYSRYIGLYNTAAIYSYYKISFISDPNITRYETDLILETPEEYYYVLTLFYWFNTSEFFIYTLNVDITYNILRNAAFTDGLLLMSLGGILIISDQIIMTLRLKRLQKYQEEDLN